MSVSGGTMSGKKTAQDPIMSVLSVLRDTQRFEDRLKKLTDAEKSLREATAKYDKMADLNRARAAAIRAKERAESALAEAEGKAQKIVQEAEERASALRQEIQGERSNFVREAREKDHELKARESELAGNEEDYSRRSAALKRSETAARKKTADNLSLKRDLERKASTLKAACNEVLA